MSDIFREIEEELRRDNFLKLWQRYGKYVIAAAVVVVVAAAVIVGWRQYSLHQRQAEGVRYGAALALATQGKSKEAAQAFAAMSPDLSSGRAVLARFEEAALKAKNGDGEGALALYQSLAADGANPAIYRDLARLLAARLTLIKDPKSALVQLKPLTDPANPWHASALELTAVGALEDGDKAAARKTYQQLADDLNAPAGLRARAAEMVAALAQQ